MRSPRALPHVSAALVVALVGLLVSACGGGSSAPTANAGTEKFDKKTPITLTVSSFGDFGYQDLYEKFEKMYPNITIKERLQSFEDHHTQLAAHLATGSGAADIESVEEGFAAQFKATPDKFVNLFDYGAKELEDRWLPWVWSRTLSADGTTQIGFGTDVGGVAICYRTDLFAEAGLPTDRDEVSALWPTWADYLSVGKEFQAATPGKVKFFDGAGNVFNAMLAQAKQGTYNEDNTLNVENNAEVKDAFFTTAEAVEAGLSAELAPFSPEWNTGFQQGSFASLTCPAWMTGYIQDQAKATAGKWDIAAVPGEGGNWGGSFLTIPKQSENPREAYELIKFLTSPESQAYVFKQTGNLPSQPALYDDPAITGFTKPFFNDAPVGKIYTEAAKALEPQYQGPKAGTVKAIIGSGLVRVEQGKQTPDEAWAQVLSDLEKLQ